MPLTLRCLLLWLLLSPLAVYGFEAVDVLRPSSSGRFLAYPSEPILPYELWAQFGLMYDTNILRRTVGDNNETVARGSVGGRWDQRIVGRQGLHLVGQVDGFVFNKFGDLDNIGYYGLGEWRYAVGNDLAGSIGLSRRKYQASLAQTRRAVYDPITRQNYFANGRYALGPHLGLRGAVDFADFRRPRSAAPQIDAITATAGVDYITDLGNAIGLEVRQARGDAPVSQVVDRANLFPGNQFSQRDVAVVTRWVATPQVSFAGNVGRTTRTYNVLPGFDFSGTTWRAALQWAPFTKVYFDFENSRYLSSLIDVGAAHVIVRGWSFGPSWAVTAKTNVSARFLRQNLDYGGDADALVTGTAQRREIVRSFRLGAYWEYTRKIHVTAAWENGERQSNVLGGNFRYNAYMANVKYFF